MSPSCDAVKNELLLLQCATGGLGQTGCTSSTAGRHTAILDHECGGAEPSTTESAPRLSRLTFPLSWLTLRTVERRRGQAQLLCRSFCGVRWSPQLPAACLLCRLCSRACSVVDRLPTASHALLCHGDVARLVPQRASHTTLPCLALAAAAAAAAPSWHRAANHVHPSHHLHHSSIVFSHAQSGRQHYP